MKKLMSVALAALVVAGTFASRKQKRGAAVASAWALRPA